MSRKGKASIPLPKGVEVKVSDLEVSVKGPKGLLKKQMGPQIEVEVKEDSIEVHLKDEYQKSSQFHGLYRSLISNMVEGTTKGYEKKLQMIGVGYRAAVKGNELDLQIGLSHPSSIPVPAGIEVKVEKNTLIVISGIDKQEVGQFAASIRSLRPPEPYQGKGIRYQDEYVRRKAGKSASKK